MTDRLFSTCDVAVLMSSAVWACALAIGFSSASIISKTGEIIPNSFLSWATTALNWPCVKLWPLGYASATSWL